MYQLVESLLDGLLLTTVQHEGQHGDADEHRGRQEPMIANVLAAFFAFGRLKAGTPLLIASTSVSAVQPDANARISSSTRPSPT